jgi:Fe2+-dicitrate sensor, membrane component
MTKKNVSRQQIENLLDNDLFMQWVLHPTQDVKELWEKHMNSDEELRNNSKTLKSIIENLKVKEPELSEREKRIVWNKIEKAIDGIPKNKFHTLAIWSSSLAASVIIGLAVYFFFIKQKTVIDTIDYSSYITEENEDDMKTGNINLILSDNKQIHIEKDSVVISYNEKGGININSEKIEKSSQAKKTTTPELNQLIVPYGKTTSLILSDGTKIWVNSGSKLIYPAVFDNNKREIFISGEAFLDVAKNEKIPFVVKTNDVQLNVLGTSFNVSAYNDDSANSVVLVSGSVEVKSNRMQGLHEMKPNQMFSYNKESSKINIQEVNVIYYTAWVNGYIYSDKESLDSVFQKLARHFNVVFLYNKENFIRETFSGKLDLKIPLEDILKNISIATSNKLQYEITEKSIHLILSN